MAVSDQNFSGLNKPPAPFDAETEFIRCNFAQPMPEDIGGGTYRGVRLWLGDDTPRTFRRCNLTNCEVPPGSTVDQCLTIMKQYDLDGDIDRVTIDGVTHDVQRKINRLHGRWEAGTYIDLPAPEDEDVTPEQSNPLEDVS